MDIASEMWLKKLNDDTLHVGLYCQDGYLRYVYLTNHFICHLFSLTIEVDLYSLPARCIIGPLMVPDSIDKIILMKNYIFIRTSQKYRATLIDGVNG